MPMPRNNADKFWRKVQKTDTCWDWTASLTSRGYGQFCQNFKRLLAHRYAYELLKGPIPEGMTVDHLCRNRRCVNPRHLRVVTAKENVLCGVGPTAINATKTHCKNGHPFDERNTCLRASGGRRCRACARDIYHRRKVV